MRARVIFARALCWRNDCALAQSGPVRVAPAPDTACAAVHARRALIDYALAQLGPVTIMDAKQKEAIYDYVVPLLVSYEASMNPGITPTHEAEKGLYGHRKSLSRLVTSRSGRHTAVLPCMVVFWCAEVHSNPECDRFNVKLACRPLVCSSELGNCYIYHLNGTKAEKYKRSRVLSPLRPCSIFTLACHLVCVSGCGIEQPARTYVGIARLLVCVFLPLTLSLGHLPQPYVCIHTHTHTHTHTYTYI